MPNASLLNLTRMAAVVTFVTIVATGTIDAFAQTRSSPLTLGTVLRAVTSSSATGDARTPGLTDAAGARAQVGPSL